MILPHVLKFWQRAIAHVRAISYDRPFPPGVYGTTEVKERPGPEEAESEAATHDVGKRRRERSKMGRSNLG